LWIIWRIVGNSDGNQEVAGKGTFVAAGFSLRPHRRDACATRYYHSTGIYKCRAGTARHKTPIAQRGNEMKKTFYAVAIVVILSLAGVLANAAELPPIPPMPEKFKDIQIVKPDPSVPKEIAAFLGEWEGILIGTVPFRRAKIIVYELYPQKIKFLYGCGDNPFGSQYPGGWSQNESDLYFENEKYRFPRRTARGYATHFYFENGALNGMESSTSRKPAFFL